LQIAASVLLLLSFAVRPAWAADLRLSKPCANQSSNESANQSIVQRIDLNASGSEFQPEAERLFARSHSNAVPEDRVPGRRAHGFCLQSLARNLFADQRDIWTSPLHLRALPASEKKQFALFGAATLGLVASDKTIMRNFGSTSLAHSNSFSNYGLAGMVGGATSLYFRGVARGDDHSREAGLLAGEATVDSAILAETLKISFQRPRPNAAHAGSFGAGGNSFPSEHSIAAWSIATVIAHEYPGPMTKLLAYGMASGISTR
jgi:membrane-associated phospholipid phosphatase